MSEVEYKSIDSNLLVCDSNAAKPCICAALDGGTPFMDLVGLFYNGDIQPVYVYAAHHKLTIMLDTPIYSDLKGYQMINSRLTSKVDGDTIIYDLARLLNTKWLMYILNSNRHLLDSMITVNIEEDEDRGFDRDISIYRINGGEFISS